MGITAFATWTAITARMPEDERLQGESMAQAEQYFAAEPQSKDVRRKLHVTLRGNEADVEVSNGVFSGNRVDLGTSVLLRQAPEPPEEGTFLDLGCGWGPIALTLGFESPEGRYLGVGCERTRA